MRFSKAKRMASVRQDNKVLENGKDKAAITRGNATPGHCIVEAEERREWEKAF